MSESDKTFRLQKKLSDDALGGSYQAEDTRQGKLRTVRLITTRTYERDRLLSTIRDGLEKLKDLTHPNILQSTEVMEEGDTIYLVSEAVDKTLRQVMEERRLGVSAVVQLARQVALALAYAHQGGVVHGNLTPEHIFFDPNGEVKVGGFGLPEPASLVAEGDAESLRKLLPYISPELAKGEAPSPASDMFSFGVILYELLTGKPPCEADNFDELLKKQELLPSVARHFPPEVPSALSYFVERLLSVQPSGRFPDWLEVVGALKRVEETLGELSPPAPIVPDAIGKIIGGKYRVEKELGVGGMGVVFKAIEEQTGEPVAVKMLQRLAQVDPEIRERFEREAEALQRLQHPNIVRVLDVGRFEEGTYLVMEYMESSLDQILRVAPLPPLKACEVICEIGEALHYAHSLGITHRDIKPSNIMFDREGHAKLCDFGIARIEDSTTLTATGMMVGTPAYMSPEQAEGKRATPRSDQYSLGIVSYQMLTGKLPFEGETALAVLRMHKLITPPPPRKVNPTVTGALSSAVMRMMEKSPEERFPNMQALVSTIRRLQDAIRTQVLPVPEEPPHPQVQEEPEEAIKEKAHNYAGIVLLSLLVLLVAFVGWKFYKWRTLPPAELLRRADRTRQSSPDRALKKYRGIIKRFPGTTEARLAQSRINAIQEEKSALRESFNSFLSDTLKAVDQAREKQENELRKQNREISASRIFQNAMDDIRKGKPEEARKRLRHIIRYYPDTDTARKAQKELQRLSKPSSEEPPSPQSEEPATKPN